MDHKAINISTSRILQAVSVPVFDTEGGVRKKILPVWGGEAYIDVNECDQIGLPKGIIQEEIKKGNLEKYFWNGIKKIDSSRKAVYIKLSDVRKLYK